MVPRPVGIAPLPKAGRSEASPLENLWGVGFALACGTDQVTADLVQGITAGELVRLVVVR